MKRLFDKQDNIIKDAKHLLKVLEAGYPTYIMVDICSAWEKWEEVCTSNPKNHMIQKVFARDNESLEVVVTLL